MIVAHGQPSDPAPAEAELAMLAAAVAGFLPGWTISSATLADPAALPRAVTDAAGLVYPMFMAGGWFTTTHLPQRLASVGAANWHILPSFGLDANVQSLTVDIALAAAQNCNGLSTNVLLAAHGSFRSSAPSDVAYAMVKRLQSAGLTHVEAGFIDQSPQIAEVARNFGANAICLPFFAAKGGHVIDDLPQALAEGGFTGQILPPVGLDPRVPSLIAQALQAAQRQVPVAKIG